MLQQLETTLRQLAWLQPVDFGRFQLLLITLGLAMLLLALFRLLRRRKHNVSGLLFLGLGLIAVVLGHAVIEHQLKAYEPLLPEREVLQLQVFSDPGNGNQAGQRIRLERLGESGGVSEWRLDGRAWQISARALAISWSGQTRRIYQFWHLTRVFDNDEKRAYRLAGTPGPDLWQWLHDYFNWLPVVKAETMTSELHPIKPGKNYRVALLPGLIRVTEASALNDTQLDSPAGSP